MLRFLLVTISIAGLSSFGQISVNFSDFPAVDDTAMISLTNDITLDYSTTGAGSTWDYSDLEIDNQRIDTFYNASDASLTVQAVFNNPLQPDYDSDYYNNNLDFDIPGAEGMGLSFENISIFTKNVSGAVEKTGIGFNISGLEIPAKYDKKDTSYVLPMTYNDNWEAYAYLNIDLNPAYNAILRRHQYRTSTVDGWGSITTPFGTFDALRVKTDLSFDDSLYTDTLGWISLPTPDRHEYTWWTNGQKVPVLKIVTNGPSGTEVITRIEFKDKDRGFMTTEENNISVGVYPNPSGGMVSITASQQIQSFKLYDLSGREVLSEELNARQTKLNLSAFKKGVYLLKVSTDNGIFSKRLVLK